MFRKSLTFSLMVHLGIGAFLAGGAARADGGWPEGEIEFTADNASEVFLNGESLGVSNNWKDDPVIKPVTSKLKQGKNVIAVAAWDYEAIAAMSGKFKMPDGTEFDTSKNQIKNWYAWDAAPGVKTTCNKTGCIEYGGKKWGEKGFNPLKDLENDGTNIDIPKNWNEISFEHDWDNPGWANGDDIWNKQNYNRRWMDLVWE